MKRNRNDKPEPPYSVGMLRNPDTAAAAAAARRRNGLRGFPWFFTKQLISVALFVFGIIIVDFLVISLIFIAEEGFISLSPSMMTNYVAESLQPPGTPLHQENDEDVLTPDASAEGSEATEVTSQWTLDESAKRYLAKEHVWALLLKDGQAIWEFEVPYDIPRSYSINDIAVSARYGSIEQYPCYYWDMGDSLLLIVGYPKGAFQDFSIHLSREQASRLPLNILLVLSIDAFILLLYVIIRRQRTRRATIPIAEALDDLASGRPVHVSVGGDLQEVGRTLNEASATIRAKDEARERWIAGVSHDIRTPLSMILGKADALKDDQSLSLEARNDAQMICAQSQRIADLITDLNTAMRLEYDTQPIDVVDVALAPLVRTIGADYLNGRLPKGFDLQVIIEEAAEKAVFRGDSRLVDRAIQNLLQNAILHNPQGCSITVAINVKRNNREQRDYAHIGITDTGIGMDIQSLAALNAKLDLNQSVDTRNAHGLGLVLVKRIAHVHGGDLTIATSAGAGFSAIVSLPVVLNSPINH